MPVIAFHILKIILCSAILFGYYWLALRNKIFHQYNRFYLLASVVLSMTLPFIQINIMHAPETGGADTIRLLKVVSSGNEYLDEIIVTARSNHFTTTQIFQLLYASISLVFLSLFVQSILKIRKLYSDNQHSFTQNICLINTNEKGTPFSFLKYIFWNNNIDISSITGKQILKHELAHVKQKHTHDKLFINAVLIFLWCNPFYWLIRKEMNIIHEFIADKIALEDSDTAAFASMVLQATFPQQNFHLTNQFFYSPIKRRLTMLTKNQHSKAGYIGRVLVLPLMLLTFAAFSLKNITLTQSQSTYNGNTVTIVLNAGHGGNDFGATSLSGKIYEKDITLSITKKIKALNSNKNFNIILTRENDTYQSPQAIATFTNAQNPDLYVSIHLDAAEKNSQNSSGMNVLVAKDNFSNAEKSKLFASAIINEFSNHYPLPVAPNPLQKEKGIWALQEIKCPSVLIETGYISNKKDIDYLMDEKNQEQIARNILNGMERYAANTEKNKVANSKSESDQVNFSTKDTVPNVINFTVKKISVQKNDNASDSTVNTVEGNLRIEKNDMKKMMIIINGKKIDNPSLQNVTINSKTAKVYSSNNKEAIDKYGYEAANGIIIFEEANIEKNEKNGTIIHVDSATLIGVDAVKNELQVEDSKPLYVVDGAIKNELYVKGISPDDIDHINVLKDKHAIDKYGEKGKNGVVEIVTKNKNQKPIKKQQQSKPSLLKATSDTTKPIDDKIFTKVENEPDFIGGMEGWKKYLTTNIDPTLPVQEGWKPGKYEVVVEFIVDKEGNISNVNTINYQGTKTAAHCINLIQKGPKWQPASQNGHIVKAYRRQPISFVIQ